MKKIIILLLAIMMCVACVACRNDAEKADKDKETPSATVAETQKPVETQVTTVEPTATPTQKPTAIPTPEPTATPTPEPTIKPSVTPVNPETSLTFKSIVNTYSGMWYLDGYANVYLHIYETSDGWLQFYTNNFLMPDIDYGREDGIVYPFLYGIVSEEYLVSIVIPPGSAWKDHVKQCRIVFDSDCIYAGSYKFVKTPGTIEKIFCLSHHWDVPTCKIPSTCIYCGCTEGSPVECQYIDGVCHFCGGISIDYPTATEPPVLEPQPVQVNGVTLDLVTLNLIIGNTQQLTATVLPSNADNKNVTWTSSNSSVAQVSSSGKVTAKGEGTAIITVTTKDGGYTASCMVTVSVIHVNGIQISDTTLNLYVGDIHQLTATVLPSNAENKNVTWTSSNTSVVQVSSNGRITAKGKGTAVITVITVDGSFTDTCTVTVIEPPLTVKASIGISYSVSSVSGTNQCVYARATATGGSGTYVEYYIKLYYNGILIAEAARDEVTVPVASGTYKAEIYVKDSSGNEITYTKSAIVSATASGFSVSSTW